MSEPIECPECKGKGQKWLHLLYAKGKGQSGWQWKICWRCKGEMTIGREAMACIEQGKSLNALMKSRGLRNQLECLAKSHGIDGVELSNALMGRTSVERIREIEGFVMEIEPKPL